MIEGRIGVVLLAAGRSSRMGGPHKLLATFDGEALIRRSARIALAAGSGGVIVVLGYGAPGLRAELEGLPLKIVLNQRFAEGFSTSLIAGCDAAPTDWTGFLVMLADQPSLSAGDLDCLIDGFSPDGFGSIVVATDRGHRFNPVVLSRLYEPEIRQLVGDVGARSIVAAHPMTVREIEIGRAASLDVDTPETLKAAGGVAPF